MPPCARSPEGDAATMYSKLQKSTNPSMAAK